MITYHKNIIQGTPEWHSIRRGIVTASIAGKLITPTGKVANNDTVRQLAFSLAAERITGRTEEGPSTFHLDRGHTEEVFARELYAKNYDSVEQCGFIDSDELGFRVGYSPDGVTKDGLIEIKSRMQKFQIQTICSGEVPDEYMAQLQFGLLVSDRPYIDFIQYSNGMELFVKRVIQNPAFFSVLIESVTLFEDRVKALVDDYKEKSIGLVVADLVEIKKDEDEDNF